MIPSGWDIFYILAMTIGPFVLWELFGGKKTVEAPVMRIQRHMKDRGYGVIGVRDARMLYQNLGEGVFLIMPREDIEVIPGYREGDIQSLIVIAKDGGLARPRKYFPWF